MRTSSIDKIEEGRYNVTSIPCPGCSTTMTTELSGEKLFGHNQGAMTHQTLSHLDADDRERFISGTCKNCWSDMFGSDEEEEEHSADNQAASRAVSQSSGTPVDRASHPDRVVDPRV